MFTISALLSGHIGCITAKFFCKISDRKFEHFSLKQTSSSSASVTRTKDDAKTSCRESELTETSAVESQHGASLKPDLSLP